MRSDCLALAVFVGCKVEGTRCLENAFQFLNNGATALGELVGRFKSVVDVYRQALARKVGDVADRCAYVKAITKKFGDRFGLGGGLDYDEGLRHDFSSLRCFALSCQGYPRKAKCSKGLISLA